MTTLKNVKGIAKIVYTKTWGYHVVDYKNLVEGKPTQTNHKSIEDANKKFNELTKQ